MKLNIKQLLVLACLLISTLSFGQAPQKFNYQGIARDVKGNPLAKQKMSLKISVLPTQDATVSEYEETQMVTTNEFGLYTLQIGNGTPITGEMKTVKWETGNKYIRIAIDQKGGTDYVDAGTTQLLSVPYAIYADKAGLARETVEGTDKTRTGTVSSNAAHVAGDANYVSKFTALNTIGKSSIYDNGTNVGIGTSSPAATLNLKSTSSNELLRMQSTSSTGFGKFTMYNDLNYATFTKYGSTAPGTYFGLSSFPNASLLAFGNNGGGFLISNGGNVGLSILKASSKMKFYIDYNTENVGIGGNANAATQIHFNSDKTGDTLKITNTTSGHLSTDGLDIRTNGNAAEIINRENSSLAFGTNNAESMRIDASGNVGIGTTSPTAKLEIKGDPSSFLGDVLIKGNSSLPGMTIKSSTGDIGAGIRFEDGSSGNSNGGIFTGSNSSYFIGNLIISTDDNLNTAEISINKVSKYVGIGKYNASCKLDVSGTDGSYLLGKFSNNSATGDRSSLISFVNGNSIPSNWLIGTGGTGNGLGITDGSFYIEKVGAGANFVIDNVQGNVGIGLQNPNQKLHVNGNIRLDSTIFIGTVEQIKDAGSYELGFDATCRPYLDGSDNLGTSSHRWGTVFATNGTINTSDKREKQNIKSLNYGIQEVMALKPVTFEWKSRPELGTKIGFIAQDLQNTIPEVVNSKDWIRGEDGKMISKESERLGVYYSDIIPVLTNAIQEQQKMIEDLKKEIELLKSK